MLILRTNARIFIFLSCTTVSQVNENIKTKKKCVRRFRVICVINNKSRLAKNSSLMNKDDEKQNKKYDNKEDFMCI